MEERLTVPVFNSRFAIRLSRWFLVFSSSLFILPLIYLSAVRCVSQFIVATDTSSLWEASGRPDPAGSPAPLKALAFLDPLNPDYPYLMADRFAAEHSGAALRLNEKAISLSPLSPRYRIQKGWMEAARGNLPEACQSFEKAIFLDPKYADAYAQQGLFLFQASPYVDPQTRPFYFTMAEQSLSLAAKYDPSLLSNPAVAFALASILNDRGGPDKARAVLRKADEAATLDLGLLVRKWALQFRLGDTKRPVSQWAALFSAGKLSEDQLTTLAAEMAGYDVPDFTYFMSQIHIRKGDTPAALEELTSLTSQRPYVAEYRLALGDVYEKLGKPGEALAQYEKALELSPSNQYAKTKAMEYYKKK